VSGCGDDDSEMPRHHPLDDAAIEAFFTGQPADEDLAPLAGFVEDLESMTSGPVPVPALQLAAMLADGFPTENGDLLATAASNVTGPAQAGVRTTEVEEEEDGCRRTSRRAQRGR